MTYSHAITTRIISLCNERGITVNRLATLSGLAQSTVDNITRGVTKSPGLRTLHLLAQGFGMTISEFLNFPLMNEEIFEDD